MTGQWLAHKTRALVQKDRLAAVRCADAEMQQLVQKKSLTAQAVRQLALAVRRLRQS